MNLDENLHGFRRLDWNGNRELEDVGEQCASDLKQGGLGGGNGPEADETSGEEVMGQGGRRTQANLLLSARMKTHTPRVSPLCQKDVHKAVTLS